jgi:hypothetical protein
MSKPITALIEAFRRAEQEMQDEWEPRQAAVADLRKEIAALKEEVALPPILITIPHAATMISRGVRFIYDAIATRKIRAVKSDKRTLVVVASLHEYVASLPAPKIKPLPPYKRRRRQGREVAR